MEKSRHYSWLLALISAVVASGLHLYLSSKFYALRFGALAEQSFCNLSETWNCDAVSASHYAQFLGVPLAVWGFVTNVIFALLLLMSRIGWIEDQKRSERYTFWVALLVFGASVVMGLISLTQLAHFCLFCVFAYILSIISLIGTYVWSQPKVLSNLGDDLRNLFIQNKGVLASFIVIPAGAFFVNSIFVDRFNMGTLSVVATEKIMQWKAFPEQKFNKETGLVMYKGQGEPKMEIVEFADFRCPHCRDAYFSLHNFVSARSDVKLTFKYFPLDGTCNPAMEGRGDYISCEAAFVTHCSEKLFQKGWAAHNYLFDNQAKLSSFTKREEVREFACKNLGIDCAALTTCTESPDTKTEIQLMAKEGIDAGVKGTPTIYVGGRLLQGGQLIPILEKAYQSHP